MRIVLQRVRHGAVDVEGQRIAEIGRGVVLLVGITTDDGMEAVEWLASKVAHLRIFEDDEGKMNRSLLDVGGEALVVSQFTLYGDARKGRRPSFTQAAPPEKAAPLIDAFAEALRREGVPVQTGRFGAHMLVLIENDGPVTLILER
ncbi:D-tyrosyl-tRNA(Tyr) deacylase [Ardenticatena maritima]|uniref:D-aminoacyl-tRNA deacylase n=1 Tax=Ardenticatena maritima TaxID=872965 RepID=A0A0M9UC67_9CHLR|nr:D-aminoacyl-tRNA deacylase [Ardenticatena maritima]KPL87231.1 D-tyrosyl-tRNA(Tyr) deacylase [Ardenticatena maritima]GAP62614.1 D-tyrosyl-tRNA(Tyr) deacylase [Ardenticatena maritima]